MKREEAWRRAKGYLYDALSGEEADEIIKALEQEPCEDEYIKVPKKALKYRTAGMVAYNVEWLKNHFDIEELLSAGSNNLVKSKRQNYRHITKALRIADRQC